MGNSSSGCSVVSAPSPSRQHFRPPQQQQQQYHHHHHPSPLSFRPYYNHKQQAGTTTTTNKKTSRTTKRPTTRPTSKLPRGGASLSLSTRSSSNIVWNPVADCNIHQQHNQQEQEEQSIPQNHVLKPEDHDIPEGQVVPSSATTTTTVRRLLLLEKDEGEDDEIVEMRSLPDGEEDEDDSDNDHEENNNNYGIRQEGRPPPPQQQQQQEEMTKKMSKTKTDVVVIHNEEKTRAIPLTTTIQSAQEQQYQQQGGMLLLSSSSSSSNQHGIIQHVIHPGKVTEQQQWHQIQKASSSQQQQKSHSRSSFSYHLSYKRFWKNVLAAIILPFLLTYSILEMEHAVLMEKKLQQQELQRQQRQEEEEATQPHGNTSKDQNEVWGDDNPPPPDYYMFDNEDDDDELVSNETANVQQHESLSSSTTTTTRQRQKSQRNFPLPKLLEWKEPPKAVYTSRLFDNGISSSDTLSWSKDHINVHLDYDTYFNTLNDSSSDKNNNTNGNDDNDDGGEDPFYEPSGQHLLVDISNVSPSFLFDMERLAHAMVALTTQSELTLLSYHCHEWKQHYVNKTRDGEQQDVGGDDDDDDDNGTTGGSSSSRSSSGGGGGVSCMGVLLESHLSLHTWPLAGILSLDLFTCGSRSLLPLIPIIQDLFAISPFRSTNNTATCGQYGYGSNNNSSSLFTLAGEDSYSQLPVVRWLHKKRGYRGPHYKPMASVAQASTTLSQRGIESTVEDNKNNNADNNRVSAELGQKSVNMEAYLLGWMGYRNKQLLANVQTRFQHVQVYQASLLMATVPPLSRHHHLLQSEQPSISNSDGYYNQQVMDTNKMLYLDGTMRSSLYGLEAYHEALVQPALMAHENPQRVAILGGGEGATLREVLKHTTVTDVVMVEQDDILVELSREFLPEWNDCSHIILPWNTTLCFDDPRVQLVVDDAFEWFIQRYGRNSSLRSLESVIAEENQKFDVIIVDAL